MEKFSFSSYIAKFSFSFKVCFSAYNLLFFFRTACQEGFVYKKAGQAGNCTCLNDKWSCTEFTESGCFCPEEQYLQNGKCVDKSNCPSK